MDAVISSTIDSYKRDLNDFNLYIETKYRKNYLYGCDEKTEDKLNGMKKLGLKCIILDRRDFKVLKIVKNLLGIGDEESNVQLKIRPTIKAGQREIQAANYIPINFVVGGQKK